MSLNLSYDKYQNQSSTKSGGLDLSYDAFINPPPPPKSFTEKLGGWVSGALNSGLISKPLGINTGVSQLGLNVIKDTATNLWNTWQQTPQKMVDVIKTGAKDLQGAKLSDFIGINTGMGVPGLSGQSGKAIAKVSLGTMGTAVNAVYAPLSAAIGAALGQTGGQKLIDSTGQVIADSGGITNMPAFQQFAMTHPNAGQYFQDALSIAMAGADTGKIDPKTFLERTKKTAMDIINNSPKPVNLPVQSQGGETNIPISTPKTRQANYAKSQGYEPYTPIDQLPTIDMGTKPVDNTLPTIQTEVPTSNKLGSMTVEPIKDLSYNTFTSIKSGEFTPTPKVSEQPVTPETPLPPREPGVTKTASDINQTLVKQGFDALPVEEQAKYTPQSYKLIATDVANLMDTNIESAKNMAKGTEPLSPEMQRNPEILFNAVEAHAIKNGDVQLLQDLAKSPVSQTSRAGQILGGHGFNDNPNSVVKTLDELNTELKTKIEKQTGKKYAQVEKPVVDEVKTAKNSVKVTKETWSDFINKIKCQY